MVNHHRKRQAVDTKASRKLLQSIFGSKFADVQAICQKLGLSHKATKPRATNRSLNGMKIADLVWIKDIASILSSHKKFSSQ